MCAFSNQRVLNITEQLPEYRSEMERNKRNLQTEELFRPLRSRQCSSEWFENWDMSNAQWAINKSHTDKQWHILFSSEYQSAQTQKSEQFIMQSGIKSKREQKQYVHFQIKECST